MTNNNAPSLNDTTSKMEKRDGYHRKPNGFRHNDLHCRRYEAFHGEEDNGTVPNDVQSDDKQKPVALHHRPRVPRKSKTSSDLNAAFDPMKDMHMWTMWRAAVNGRMVDEVKRLERARREYHRQITDGYASSSSPNGASSKNSSAMSGAPPLSRFIRMDEHSRSVALSLGREVEPGLGAIQFVYYGLPRVVFNVDRQHEYKPTPQNSNGQNGIP